MSSRFQRPSGRAPVAPVHRGPQALPPGATSAPAPFGAFGGYNVHAPNAALLIDFDNVTMGIQKDMQAELRNLMSSDIIKGKVSVQRAYADWRRYPGYIVPLTEASIDLIFAPAYGSAKKNATDIRLAIDAMELVFTRPEIGTFILLSGDSDFSSLVIKLKEYGKYVIGVGIRESSSDLLVQNCDEYYSYNALAGLVRAGDEEVVRWDPWELVTEAMTRMTRNGDTMRADRLKQVMQDIDPSFDEKDLGMSKFSRFVSEAAHRGLIALNRLDNGQFEIGPAGAATAAPAAPAAPAAEQRPPRREEPRREERRPEAHEETEAEAAEAPGRRDERGRRGRRGRGRGREERGPRTTPVEGPPEAGVDETNVASPIAASLAAPAVPAQPAIGVGGERLTRNEAFDLVRRAVDSLVPNTDESVAAEPTRRRAYELLGRDSESLTSRMFERILRDAHDAGLIDLRRRGDSFELSRAASTESVADQLNRAAAASQLPTVTAPSTTTGAPRGMGPRGLARGRQAGRGAPPPDLLSVGVVRVEMPAAAATAVAPERTEAAAAPQPPVALEDGGAAATPTPATTPEEGATEGASTRRRGGRGGRGGRKSAAKGAAKKAAPAAPAPAAEAPSPAPAKAPAASGAGRGRAGRGAKRAAGTAAPAAKAATPAAPAAPAAKRSTPAAGGAAKRGRAAAPAAAAPSGESAPPASEAAGGGRGARRGRKRPAARAAE
jgi:uncharacterized protein (TIGR00288 family)